MQPDIAPVIVATPGRILFRVDDVTPAAEPLPLSPLQVVLERVLDGPLLASSYAGEVELVDSPLEASPSPRQAHPLIAAIHLAYRDHRPLVLSPDAIWLTIAQGFAQHVNLHHERLRDRLVRHEGKRELTIRRTHLQSASDWAEAVQGWASQIADEVGPGLARVLTCDFSTTTAAARTASQIVLMDAHRRYFDYRILMICGIPALSLLGTPDDWRRIRERIELLTEYDLEWWVARLRPICDALLQTAEGQPPRPFWQQIYALEGAYGGDVVTGWAVDLFPYLNHPVSWTPTWKNPLLLKPVAEITADDGLSLQNFPSGLSEVSCHLQGPEGTAIARLVGGFVGVRQYLDGGLTPLPGWAVGGVDAFAQLLHRLSAHASTAAPIAWHQQRGMVALPKEGLQLLDTFHGTTLFAGSGHGWRVREVEELASYRVVGSTASVSVLMDLDDGRVLGTDWHTTFHTSAEGRLTRYQELWVVVGQPREHTMGHSKHPELVLVAAETVVIAKGFDTFLEHLLDAEGAYYFDTPGFIPAAVVKQR